MTVTDTPDFSKGCAFVRGQYVPIERASIPITDLGFLHSDATYDVVTVWNGAFFRLDAHLERFRRSCQRWRLDPQLSDHEITAILSQCVRLSGLQSSYVEMLCTRGQTPWGSRDPRQAVNQFYAFAVPYVWIANEQQRVSGLSLRISDIQRIPPDSVDPTIKNYHWSDLTMGLLAALDSGADTVVLVDRQGHVVEGTGFNIFCVREGTILTPESGMLEGVTRRTVIEMAQTLGIKVQIRAVTVQEFSTADEVFVTSSGGGVIAVTFVDEKVIGQGKPGAMTLKLAQTYWAWHEIPAMNVRVND